MFFSNHHQNVVYDTWYPGPYTLYGDVLSVGTPVGQKRKVCVRAEDLDAGPGRLNPSKYKTLVIEAGVCGLEKGFVESFPNLKDLIVEADLDRIPLTPELEKLLKSNQVILRGVFNSAAEQLAKKLGLTFIHTNLLVARHFEECRYERTTLMLCFQKGECPFIWEDIITPGISAGNNGGGTLRHDLPSDFYKGCTIEKFAHNFASRYTDAILRNEALVAFLQEANRRGPKAWTH